MAEVLITLGVIGVVAALTMPSLIANYQKKVWVNQLKKTYATLNEGFRQIMAKEVCTDLRCAGIAAAVGPNDMYYYTYEYIDFFLNKMIETFKLSNVENLSASNSSNNYSYTVKTGKSTYTFNNLLPLLNDTSGYSNKHFLGTTPDGSVLAFSIKNNNSRNEGPYIIVDINGQKGPNAAGRDIFLLMLGNNNQVVIYGSKLYWDSCGGSETFNDPNKTSPNHASYEEAYEMIKQYCLADDILGAGMSCAAVIEHDGWQMNY